MHETFAGRETELNHYLIEHVPYKMYKYSEFNYNILKKINTFTKRSGGHSYKSNEIIIMADTETSKDPDHKYDTRKKKIHGKWVDVPVPYENHICAWTISIRAAGCNICTLYGTDPRSHIETIEKIHNAMRGNVTYIFYHNMSYDWQFLRQFYMERFGKPIRQLNTKPHYPISIEFSNGIILRDSLILAQRSLRKWGADLNIEHQKEVDAWDYDKIRHQGGSFSDLELKYIEHDTLAGVECIDATRETLHKHICTLPYTATGIVREAFRKTAKKNRGRQWFEKQALDYTDVWLSEAAYHGGFTHQNRYMKSDLIDDMYTDGEPIQCYDIASSYPFALISEKYPCEKFKPIPDAKPEYIIKMSPAYATMFVFEAYYITLKDPIYPMPLLQYSKCLETINITTDNGRILHADYARIALTDVDLCLLADQYTWNYDHTVCTNVRIAAKDYLPRWFTDFVYKLFYDKTMLKGGDPVMYAIRKAMLNSCYGMCVQHVMQDDIQEDYDTGDYILINNQNEDTYQKYLDNKNTFLPYQIGVWCTCYAQKNLFELGNCLKNIHNWIYSDTDSCFGFGWDKTKLHQYNSKRIQLMKSRGYDGIKHNGRVYYLGIVELDKECKEFKGIHSKCYCYRDKKTDELKITVAGVPKSGAKCLKDDIGNFEVGFTFKGKDTKKLQHTYIADKIHTNKFGDVIGDSIDLSPCDYVIGDINTVGWDFISSDDVEIQVYE